MYANDVCYSIHHSHTYFVYIIRIHHSHTSFAYIKIQGAKKLKKYTDSGRKNYSHITFRINTQIQGAKTIRIVCRKQRNRIKIHIRIFHSHIPFAYIIRIFHFLSCFFSFQFAYIIRIFHFFAHFP